MQVPADLPVRSANMLKKNHVWCIYMKEKIEFEFIDFDEVIEKMNGSNNAEAISKLMELGMSLNEIQEMFEPKFGCTGE